MPTVKLIEVRDRATFIPALAVLLQPNSEVESFLLHQAGYYSRDTSVQLTSLHSAESHIDPLHWRSKRTMPAVHYWLIEHWTEVVSGDVIDVEYILKEVDAPKVSQRLETDPKT